MNEIKGAWTEAKYYFAAASVCTDGSFYSYYGPKNKVGSI